MRLKVSTLRRLIREAMGNEWGWPTAEVTHVYGMPDKMADQHPTDMGDLKLPKGPNSRDDADNKPLGDDLDSDAPKQNRAATQGIKYVSSH